MVELMTPPVLGSAPARRRPLRPFYREGEAIAALGNVLAVGD